MIGLVTYVLHCDSCSWTERYSITSQATICFINHVHVADMDRQIQNCKLTTRSDGWAWRAQVINILSWTLITHYIFTGWKHCCGVCLEVWPCKYSPSPPKPPSTVTRRCLQVKYLCLLLLKCISGIDNYRCSWELCFVCICCISFAEEMKHVLVQRCHSCPLTVYLRMSLWMVGSD